MTSSGGQLAGSCFCSEGGVGSHIKKQTSSQNVRATLLLRKALLRGLDRALGINSHPGLRMYLAAGGNSRIMGPLEIIQAGENTLV